MPRKPSKRTILIQALKSMGIDDFRNADERELASKLLDSLRILKDPAPNGDYRNAC